MRNDHGILRRLTRLFTKIAAKASDTSIAQTGATARKRYTLGETLFHELSRMRPSDHDFEIKLNKVISEIGRHIAMEAGIETMDGRRTVS